MGELEGPSIFRLEFRSDPEKHVSVVSLRMEDRDAFLRRVSDRVRISRRRQALVFIHGFNVSFEDATRRAAQIAYDLGFDGAPIVFSWPSQGGAGPLDYQHDVRNADLSADTLYQFLNDLTQSTNEIRVDVIAHSMGNRVLSAALQRFAALTQSGRIRRFQHVALLAPDIDAELFRRVAPQIASTAQRMTLYASSRDVALELSRR